MGGVHIFITPVQGSPPHQHASRCLTHREISIQNDTIRTVVNALDQILVVFRELVHTAPPQWNHNTPGGGPQGLFFRAQSRKKRVLHQASFFDRCEDFVALWRTHSCVPRRLVSTLGVIPHWLRLRRSVLHLFKFVAAREDFTALVERASKPATPTFLSALRAAHPLWLRLRRFVLDR